MTLNNSRYHEEGPMIRTVKLDQRKLRRRLDLLDGMIDGLIHSPCAYWACKGPASPPVGMATCHRCWALYRAIKAGLVKVNHDTRGGYSLSQVSARTGEPAVA